MNAWFTPGHRRMSIASMVCRDAFPREISHETSRAILK
jgi:hypothetical protein